MLQVLVYGTESFIQMTKMQVKSIEKIWKDAIYTVLELSKYANYSAVLFEAGLLPGPHQLSISPNVSPIAGRVKFALHV